MLSTVSGEPGVELSAGDVVAQRFQLISRLGKGGMGTVWRARHLTLASDVALKLLDPAIASSPEGRARFKREAQAAAAIRSQHVVQILDHGVHGQVPFIVMELLDGESLAQRLDRGKLSLAETNRVLLQLGRAISKAHAAGVVHRDLKPDNIFLVKNDDEEIVKVLDFGIAKARFQQGSEDTTRTGAILGTPHYMSPEQLRGDKALDHRADIWALGIIAFECVTNEKPFVSDTFPDLVIKICSEDAPRPSSKAALPESFDAWFAKSTSREPARRFESVREQVNALRSIVEPNFDPQGASLPSEREEPASQPVAIDTDGETRPAVPAVSDVALNTQHATANTRPLEPTKRKRSRAWLYAVAALALAALGVGLAQLNAGLVAEPLPVEGDTQRSASATAAALSAAPEVSASGATEAEPATAPSASTGDPRSASPQTNASADPAPAPSQPTATPKASTIVTPDAEKPKSGASTPKPSSGKPSSTKDGAPKPVATATGQVDLGI